MNASTRREVQVDQAIAEIVDRYAAAQAQVANAIDSLHSAAGDRREYIGRRRYWTMTDAEVEAVDSSTLAPRNRNSYERVALALAATRTDLAAIELELDAANALYTGWTRYFIVDGGHIHSSMHCQTCNREGRRTAFGWLPELSGLTEADAVAAHGAILCTVCYPSAPLEWTNGLEVAAQAKRDAACAGSGRYFDDSLPHETRRVSKWAVCPECHKRVTLTSTLKLRTHKAS